MELILLTQKTFSIICGKLITDLVQSRVAILKGFPSSSAIKNLPAMQETPVQFLGQQDPWRRGRLPNPEILGFPGGSDGKDSAYNVGDLG